MKGWTMAWRTGLALAAWGACTWAAAAAEVTVTNVTARQRYPWNGLVDIDFEVACSEPGTNLTLYASARDEGTGKALPVRTVKLEGGEFGEELVVKAQELPGGKGRLVWDAGKDAAGTVADAVTVEVQALAGEGMYLVLDLSAGSGDGAVYPVSFLGAEPQGGWSDEFKTTKLVLRRIMPGTYTMGSPSDELGRSGDSSSYNEIRHEVTITQPFYMGVFEVTQKQWELVMGSNPSSYTGDMRPVEYVSWNTIRGNSSTYNWPSSSEVDAASFMGKLRARAGGFAWDLPTEAQWEYACRAGTTTALNSGKNLTGTSSCTNMAEVGRYYYNQSDGKGGYTSGHTTVGSYMPNAWGLYDMHGNVWEWCLDWLASVTADAVTDPVGPASGSNRVLRGGGWGGYARDCRSADRCDYAPSGRYNSIGLRLCCSAGLR
ncbi:MAG: formylglycine-generating enzyme family protein [Kiritimatiellae bacterium]|nr:formylglycine-generating enzyme family protein [Kiritimatiellia bacterium]